MGLVADRIQQFSVVNKGMNLGDILSIKVQEKHVVSAFQDAQLRELQSGWWLYKFNSFSSLRLTRRGM